MRMPMKRSSDPRMARCSITGTRRHCPPPHTPRPAAPAWRNRAGWCRTARAGRCCPSGKTRSSARRTLPRRAESQLAPFSFAAPRRAPPPLHPTVPRTHALWRTRRQPDQDLVETEVGVDPLQQVDELHHLALDLALGAKDMGIVLGEGAHAHEAVQRTRRFIAMTRAELREPQREVTIAPDALIEHLHVARAVHRLHGEVTGSDSVVNMLSRKFSQWPDFSHSDRSITSGVRISW